MSLSSSALDLYRAVDSAAAVFARTDRVRLAIQGPDRARFLHNLTTNDIKRLAEGQSCEAFVTSIQGRTLGLIHVLAQADTLLIRTDAAGVVDLLAHFSKYGAFDDVTVDDLSDRIAELHLVGPEVASVLKGLGGELRTDAGNGPQSVVLAGVPATLLPERPTERPGWSVIVGSWDAEVLMTALRSAGVVVAASPDDEAAVWDVLRIEGGTPRFGQDFTVENLPQELDRDRSAISFVKGCYLGQETVARIDALGHVNKLLRGLLFAPGSAPTSGAALIADGKTVGLVTSVAFSPGWNRPIGLGFVRTAHCGPGSKLCLEGDDTPIVEVRPLPLVPPKSS